MTVEILEDAAEDLESGAQLLESCMAGVGNYFLDSILSDLDFLVLFAGIHPIYYEFHRMLSKRFPFGIYYERSRYPLTRTSSIFVNNTRSVRHSACPIRLNEFRTP